MSVELSFVRQVIAEKVTWIKYNFIFLNISLAYCPLLLNVFALVVNILLFHWKISTEAYNFYNKQRSVVICVLMLPLKLETWVEPIWLVNLNMTCFFGRIHVIRDTGFGLILLWTMLSKIKELSSTSSTLVKIEICSKKV